MSNEVSFTITARDKATKTVDDLLKKVDKLEGEPAEILLTSNAKDISKLIKQLTRDIDKLDANDAEIDVKAEDIKFVNSQLDRINAKIREIGGTPVSVNTTRLRASLDDVSRSANSSKSAMANMVGNTAQDLGAVAGIAGSTGVAIGQMAEYMTDAATDGDKLGQVLLNFGKVAGPIAVLGVVVNGIVTSMNNAAKAAAESRERTQEWVKVLGEAGDEVTNIADALREHALAQEGLVGENVKNLHDLGISYTELARLTRLSKEEQAAFIEQATGTEEAFKQYGLGLELATEQWEQFFDEVNRARELRALVPSVVDGADAFARLAEEVENANDPMARFPHLWSGVIEGLMGGDMDRAALNVSALARLLHLDEKEIIKLARGAMEGFVEAIEQGAKDAKDAAEDLAGQWAEKLKEGVAIARKAREDDIEATARWIDAQRLAAAALDDVQRQINNLADPLTATARATAAVSDALDISDNAIQSVEAVHELYDELRNIRNFLAKDLKGVVPDVFDPNDIKAGPFLDKVRALRAPFDRKFSELFATQGPRAAKEWADGFVAQMVSTLGGALTTDQVEQLLGIPEIEATIKVAVDKTDMAAALEMLDLLKSLATGSKDKAWLAQLQLDLSAGVITPQAAQKIIADALGDKGIKVPAELVPNTADAINQANSELERIGALPIDSTLEMPDNVRRVLEDTQTEIGAGVTIPVRFTGVGGRLADLFGFDAGGIVGRGGGIVGERRPEIVNNKYLVVSPTVVPAGTRVTSGARTARILRRGVPRGMRMYDAGGIVAAGPQNLNISVNAAVVGNRYDVMRAITRATRDSQRVLGRRV